MIMGHNAQFASSYGFSHQQSTYTQSNGHVEHAVQTIEGMLKKSKDPYQWLYLPEFRKRNADFKEKHFDRQHQVSNLMVWMYGLHLSWTLSLVRFFQLERSHNHTL